MIVQNVAPTKPYLPPYSDTYVVKVHYMMGDADGYETIEQAVTAEQAVAFKNLLDNTKWTKDRGYQHGGLFEAFLKTFDYEEEFEPEELFANDPDGWGYGKLEWLEVLWYNSACQPFEVAFS